MGPRLGWLLAGAVALAGCASRQQVYSEPVHAGRGGAPVYSEQQRAHAEMDRHGTRSGGAMRACPTMVPGTGVETLRTASGVAMIFRTSGDVGELRSRVQYMAEMHNQHMSGHGGMQPGAHLRGSPVQGREVRRSQGPAGAGGAPTMMTVPSRAKMTVIEDGARLELIPLRREHRFTLQDQAIASARRMQAGHCPMSSEARAPYRR